MSHDKTQSPLNGAKDLTAEEVQAEQDAACALYAKALIEELQANPEGLNVVQMYIQQRIGQVHFQSVLDAIAASGFDMRLVHREFVANLKREAEELAGPKLLVSTAVRNSLKRN